MPVHVVLLAPYRDLRRRKVRHEDWLAVGTEGALDARVGDRVAGKPADVDRRSELPVERACVVVRRALGIWQHRGEKEEVIIAPGEPTIRDLCGRHLRRRARGVLRIIAADDDDED